MMVDIRNGTITRGELTSLMFHNGTAEVVVFPKGRLFPRVGVFQSAERESGDGKNFNLTVTLHYEEKTHSETFYVKLI
jgi:hypothetical protein